MNETLGIFEHCLGVLRLFKAFDCVDHEARVPEWQLYENRINGSSRNRLKSTERKKRTYVFCDGNKTYSDWEVMMLERSILDLHLVTQGSILGPSIFFVL